MHIFANYTSKLCVIYRLLCNICSKLYYHGGYLIWFIWKNEGLKSFSEYEYWAFYLYYLLFDLTFLSAGLCPDWEDWNVRDALPNATEAMDAAEKWLDVPQVKWRRRCVLLKWPQVVVLLVLTNLNQVPLCCLHLWFSLKYKYVIVGRCLWEMVP